MYNGCKMATFCDFLVSRSARVQRPDTSSGHLMVASCFILKLQRGVNARLQPVFIFFSGFPYVFVPALFLGTVRSNREASLSLVPLVRLHAHRSFAVIFPSGTLARFFSPNEQASQTEPFDCLWDMFDVWIMFKLLFGLTPSRIFGRIVDFLIDRIVLFDRICSVLKRALFIGVTFCSAGFVLKTIDNLWRIISAAGVSYHRDKSF